MEEIDLKELFELFWEKRKVVIALILIFAVIGAIYTFGFVTPKYKSSTTLVLTHSESNDTNTISAAEANATNSITTSDVTLNSKLVDTYSELIKSSTLIRKVISNLGITDLTEDNVRKSISVTAVEDTEVIEITVVNENAVYAAKIANELAKVFTEEVKDIYNISNVHIVDEAEVAQGPYNINHLKDILIFILIGIVVAIAYILIRNMLDTSVKTVEDIEQKVKLPVIATIAMYESTEENGGESK